VKERRFGGWGFEGVRREPPEPFLALLASRLGQGEALPEADPRRFRLPKPKPLPRWRGETSREPAVRLFHCAGQSFPELVALRTGAQRAFPDGVVFPTQASEVQQVLAVAAAEGVAVVPRGGGTSVVGGVAMPEDPRPVVVLSLERLAGLLALDGRSGVATVGAGTTGPALEAALGEAGLWLGHEPQSFELSTVGGWVATRSAGQRSTGLGKIEDLVAGVEVALPSGLWRLPPQPASAMGPELRRLVCGGEGRLGVITAVSLRVRRRRQQDPGSAYLLPSFAAGLEACRRVLQEGLAPEVLRLADEEETAASLRLAQVGKLAALARGLLFATKRFARGCLLLVGYGNIPRAKGELAAALRGCGALPLGSGPWRLWLRERFFHPYLRDALLSAGFGVDTFETAAPWSALERLHTAVTRALSQVAERRGEQVLVLCHASHAYRDGACLYFTFLWPMKAGQEVEAWQEYKKASVEALLAAGGTVSHHHGVGRMHAPYLPREVGVPGVAALEALARAVDPQGILNPGVLLP